MPKTGFTAVTVKDETAKRLSALAERNNTSPARMIDRYLDTAMTTILCDVVTCTHRQFDKTQDAWICGVISINILPSGNCLNKEEAI